MKSSISIITAILVLGLTSPAESTEIQTAATALPAKKAKSEQEMKLQKARIVTGSLNSNQQSQLLELLNKGSDKELNAIKGIAEGRTKLIIGARPFKSVEEVVKIRGIGLSTFNKVLEYMKNRTVSQQPSTPKLN